MCNNRLIPELRTGTCGNGSLRLRRKQSAPGGRQGPVRRASLCGHKGAMWLIRPRLPVWPGTGAVQARQAGPGQFMLVTTGSVGSGGAAGLAIVKGHHLWCCVCVIQGREFQLLKTISPVVTVIEWPQETSIYTIWWVAISHLLMVLIPYLYFKKRGLKGRFWVQIYIWY